MIPLAVHSSMKLTWKEQNSQFGLATLFNIFSLLSRNFYIFKGTNLASLFLDSSLSECNDKFSKQFENKLKKRGCKPGAAG